MKMLRDANVAIYSLQAPHEGVEFVIFGKPNDIEMAASVLAPSFEEDLIVKRLDAPRVPGDVDVLPDLTVGDEVAWFDRGRNYKGIFDGVDEPDPTHVWVRDGTQRLRVRAESIVCAM